MRARSLFTGVAAWLTLASSAAATESCPSTRVDVADWPIVRSAKVPGFSLRLPRSFAREAEGAPSAGAPAIARWSDAARGRFTISRGVADASARAPIPSPDGRTSYARCEERVGSATALIVSYDGRAAGAGPGAAFVIHARIRWPDGEELDVLAAAADRERLDQLLAAVRSVRRTGA